MILSCVYVVAIFALWSVKGDKVTIMAMAFRMGRFVVYSTSNLAIGALLLGSVLFAEYRLRSSSENPGRAIIFYLFLLGMGVFVGTFFTGNQSAETPSANASDTLLHFRNQTDEMFGMKSGWLFWADGAGVKNVFQKMRTITFWLVL